MQIFDYRGADWSNLEDLTNLKRVILIADKRVRLGQRFLGTFQKFHLVLHDVFVLFALKKLAHR